MRDLLRTTETAYPLQSQPPPGLSESGLFQTLLVVLVIDATLTAIRGVDFVRYVFTESRFALVGVVLWLGLSALSLFLFRRFRAWAAGGFAQYRPAVATVVYAYLLSLFPLASLSSIWPVWLVSTGWKREETSQITSSPPWD